MADATHTLNIIIRVVDKATAGLNKTKNVLKNIDKSFKSLGKAVDQFSRMLKNALLGVGLSFLFTGMAIKRFFEGMLKGLVQTFLTIMGETSAQAQAVNSLQAKWEFLKWKIMSALDQSGLFDEVINYLSDIIDKTIEWVKNNPDLVKDYAKIALKALAIGTAMMVIGQVLLGMLGLVSLVDGAFGILRFTISGLVSLLTLGAAGSMANALVIIIGLLLAARIRAGSWGNVMTDIFNGMVNLAFLVESAADKILLKISNAVELWAAMQGWTWLQDMARGVGNFAAANIDEALAKAEELRKDYKDPVPENFMEGLKQALHLEDMNSFIEGLMPPTTATQTETTTVNNGDTTINIEGADFSITDIITLLEGKYDLEALKKKYSGTTGK